MSDLQEFLASLHRPTLLIRAARFGQRDYRRERDLRRLIGSPCPPAPALAIEALAEAEARAEATRKSGDAAYNAARHVDLMIALMAEAGLALAGMRRA